MNLQSRLVDGSSLLLDGRILPGHRHVCRCEWSRWFFDRYRFVVPVVRVALTANEHSLRFDDCFLRRYRFAVRAQVHSGRAVIALTALQ